MSPTTRVVPGLLASHQSSFRRVSERFVVDAAAGRLEAGLDGEPDVLETPVEFRVEPRALRVLVRPTESG